MMSSRSKPLMSGSVRSSTMQSKCVSRSAASAASPVSTATMRRSASPISDDGIALCLFVVHHQQAAFAAEEEFLDAAEFLLQRVAADRLVHVRDRALAQRAFAFA